jgi:hypothetical protein
MKRLVLSLSMLSLLTTSSQAFESGTYQCENVMGAGLDTYILKPGGRAKVITMGITTRGYWRDEGDEALVIKEKWVIEKQDDKYVLPMNGLTGDIPCIKLKKGEKPKKILPKDTKLGKALQKKQNMTQEDKDKEHAHNMAEKFIKDLPSYQMMTGMLPPQAKKQMANSIFGHPFKQQKVEIQKMIVNELNKLGKKIPMVNE